MPSSPTYFSPPSILADQPDREYQTTNVLGNFLIGASVSLVASCLSSLGVNLQASALQRNSHTTRSSSKDDVGEWEDEHVHHSGYGAISNEESSFASTSARAESPTRTEGTIRERRISSQPASSVPTSRQKAPSTTDDNDETDGFPEVWIDEIATKLSKSGGWSKDGLKGTLMKWQWYLVCT
ncbi:hypothetical protein BC832DRAFT_287571 [Gaertneriomyces semiglobifer]|nr:hypothetical protein BC832DRAFT_287571 [Gaertneriomyces semiglobifer]